MNEFVCTYECTEVWNAYYVSAYEILYTNMNISM